MRRGARGAGPGAIAAAALLLAACQSAPSPIVHTPMTAKPPVATAASQNGAIFNAGAAGLFEDRRARQVGDILTVVLEERTQASKATNTKTERSATVEANVNAFTLPTKIPLRRHIEPLFDGLAIDADSQNDFEGKGDVGANNRLTGNIAVTVIEVLPNGNLLVSGEKQTAIGQGVEYLRFSGVVSPTTISAANSVSSTKVADARVEYKGTGYLDEVQTMGWLARFFLSVAPF